MCLDDDSHPPIPLSDAGSAGGEDVSLTAADGTRVAGYLATPGERSRAQVVILPDARGLHAFYKELALRFADAGMRALACDYFGRTAETDDRSEPFDYRAHIEQVTPATFGLDLDAAVNAIRRDTGQALPTFTVGFCLGGSLSFWAGTRGYDLSGVIGFYASLTRSFGAVTPAVDWARQIRSLGSSAAPMGPSPRRMSTGSTVSSLRQESRTKSKCIQAPPTASSTAKRVSSRQHQPMPGIGYSA